MLSLTEDGTLESMRKEWWVDKGQCGFATGKRVRELLKSSQSLNSGLKLQ